MVEVVAGGDAAADVAVAGDAAVIGVVAELVVVGFV